MAPVSQVSKAVSAPQKSFLRLTGVDHLELYVADAQAAAAFCQQVLGMQLVARLSGIQDRESFVLRLGKVLLVLTAGLRPQHPIAESVKRDGPRVQTVCLGVEDVKAAYSEVRTRGAHLVTEPVEWRDEHGVVRGFAIESCGGTRVELVERAGYDGVFLPGYETTGVHGNGAGQEAVREVEWSAAPAEAEYWQQVWSYVLGFETEGEQAWQLTLDGSRQVAMRVTGDGGAGVRRVTLTQEGTAQGDARSGECAAMLGVELNWASSAAATR